VEGLRRAGVVREDVEYDQLACIACRQQWQAPACAASGGTAPTAATSRWPTRVHVHNRELSVYF
jgi:hypothetical protein